jgi:hypothetical protein
MIRLVNIRIIVYLNLNIITLSVITLGFNLLVFLFKCHLVVNEDY